MAKLVVLYRQPQDPAVFDAHYFERHVPLAKTLPGLRRFEVSRGPVASPQGVSQYHLVAELTFDSMVAIRDALGSPQGMLTGADLANFAASGVELLVFESEEI